MDQKCLVMVGDSGGDHGIPLLVVVVVDDDSQIENMKSRISQRIKTMNRVLKEGLCMKR